MALQYALLDVFADAPFQGTQIPVVMLEQELAEQTKIAIATEFQQTETVFFQASNTASPITVYNNFGKTSLGAHTILAAAYVAYDNGLAHDEGTYASYQLTQNSDVIQSFIDKTEQGPGSIQFTRTLTPTIDHFTPQVSRIAKALNIDEKHISFSKYHPMVVSIDSPTLIVPFTKAEHVMQARLNVDLWSDLLSEIYATSMFLFAPRADNSLSDFHGRLVHPDLARGVFPPIGNVIPEFIAYLAEQKETAAGTHTFTIDRGSEQTRKSVLHVEFDKHAGKATQCRIGGNVIKMGVGSLLSA